MILCKTGWSTNPCGGGQRTSARRVSNGNSVHWVEVESRKWNDGKVFWLVGIIRNIKAPPKSPQVHCRKFANTSNGGHCRAGALE